MKKCLVAAAMAAALTTSAGALAADDTVLEFSTMVGVTGPFVGPANPIRGIGGGGQAWRLDEAKGELRRDGRLEIEVRGLVLVSTGANPVAAFRGVVSCQVVDATGQPAIVTLSTGDFPATPTGDSRIEARLQLPAHCFAPIIFVTNPQLRWFSITGF